jgi:hypothetical protein
VADAPVAEAEAEAAVEVEVPETCDSASTTTSASSKSSTVRKFTCVDGGVAAGTVVAGDGGGGAVAVIAVTAVVVAPRTAPATVATAVGGGGSVDRARRVDDSDVHTTVGFSRRYSVSDVTNSAVSSHHCGSRQTNAIDTSFACTGDVWWRRTSTGIRVETEEIRVADIGSGEAFHEAAALLGA